MAKMKARATIVHYDDAGRTTKPNVRVYAMLCSGMQPEIFWIDIPDDRSTRFTSIQISRAEIERVLDANPRRG